MSTPSVDEAIAQLPEEFKQKIAAAGASALVFEMLGITPGDERSLFEKIGYELFLTAQERSQIKSALESLRTVTER